MGDLSILGGVLAVYFILLAGISAVSLVLYVLQGIGIYRMSNSLGFSAPWLGFVPFANFFAYGRIAQSYVKRDGTPSAKFSIWLLVLYILTFVFLIAFFAVAIFAIISVLAFAEEAIMDDSAMALEMFSSLVPAIILYFLALACSIAVQIVYFVSLWRIFALFDNKNATLFLVLSILFSFLPSIFIFVVSKNAPKLTYNERMGFETEKVTL